MPAIPQLLPSIETITEMIPPASAFRKLAMLVVELNARKILLTYLDSQNFYKISPDVLYFRKKLEDFILFLAKS
ncbi:MAG: hypothetical protein ACTSQQ_14900, partial [Candidatus Helarchaeota archaeon]